MFRKALAIAAGAVLVAAGMLVAPAASADIVTGNAKTECQSAGYDDGVKLDTGDDGSYSYPDVGPWAPDDIAGLTLEVEIVDNVASWTSNTFMDAVLVKAGQGYSFFDGGFEGEGVTPDDGKDISHITWCFGEAPEEDLSVEKTVETTYDRTHHWKLDKSVDPAEVWLYAPGGGGPGEAEVDWKVDVTYDGYTDSGHMVYGTITVTNEGDGAAAITDVIDTMTIDGMPGDVAVDCGVDFTMDVYFLEPGDSLECTYGTWVDGEVEGYNTASATTFLGNTFTSDDVPIMWGEPANETDKNVTVTDVSEINGETSESFTAPNGGSIEYSDTFAWDEYEECGDYWYDNTATLTSDDPVIGIATTEPTVLAEVTKTVTVHVQCVVFEGETAWAANTTAGTLPYNKKGGNWATYVQYPSTLNPLVAKTYNVYAGQTHFAGTATITPVMGGVTVTIDLQGAWEFADAASNLKIEKYNTAPSGNPSPGLFTYKTSCMSDPCTSGVIPLAKFYGIHLDVGVWVPDPDFGP